MPLFNSLVYYTKLHLIYFLILQNVYIYLPQQYTGNVTLLRYQTFLGIFVSLQNYIKLFIHESCLLIMSVAISGRSCGIQPQLLHLNRHIKQVIIALTPALMDACTQPVHSEL